MEFNEMLIAIRALIATRPAEAIELLMTMKEKTYSAFLIQREPPSIEMYAAGELVGEVKGKTALEIFEYSSKEADLINKTAKEKVLDNKVIQAMCMYSLLHHAKQEGGQENG